ncbi:MAG TPA: bifunctional DNA-formamidopyrimidine glycosylase/DNA-(apurinic or apyrimidinic site) lyase [Candidatus Dormibacteraeota bacterium]|nr:bifunctional DNA-formamidopyrimidine glycosylase/DNA-(apurinic or apyrimidinic site) lyase [Candidatus Dormibacteraeota bacterium]
MPELPEVETIVADLRPHLTGRTIVRCELIFPTIVRHPEPEVFIDSVAGMRIAAVRRRGKYILLDLQHDLMLVVHLGMTGQLRLVDADAPIEKHTHAIFRLDEASGTPPSAAHGGDFPGKRGSGRQLRYRDPRRFGRLLLGTEKSLLGAKKMPVLGPEPIDVEFAAEDLYQRLHKRRAALKAVLLDQAAIAGVGNIYADESLHRAKLRPDRLARSLSRKSVQRLHESLRESLLVAIANRGSSVDTYRDAWGDLGGQQEKLMVYGRAGEPCFTCGRPLALIRIAGRSTVFCRRCQR